MEDDELVDDDTDLEDEFVAGLRQEEKKEWKYKYNSEWLFTKFNITHAWFVDEDDEAVDDREEALFVVFVAVGGGAVVAVVVAVVVVEGAVAFFEPVETRGWYDESLSNDCHSLDHSSSL